MDLVVPLLFFYKNALAIKYPIKFDISMVAEICTVISFYSY